MKKFLVLFLSLFTLFAYSAHATEEQNALIVCDNGREMLKWDIEFIRHATKSIEIGACFLGGDVAQELLTAIQERLEQVPDLQVYVLATPILIEKEDQEKLDYLLARYPKSFHLQHATNVVMIWPEISGTDNHVKMFVVDEKYFSTGGTNLSQSGCAEGTWTPPRNTNKAPVIVRNLPAGMRDQDVVGRGKLAKELRKTFYEMYAIWENYNQTGLLEKNPDKLKDKNRYFNISVDPFVESFESSPLKRDVADSQIKMIIGGPHQKTNEITKEYVRLINNAKDEIVIANLYFCPVEPIFDALLDASKRGVKLTIITNGVSDIAPEYTQYFCWANRMVYVPMFYGSTYHFWDAWSVGKKKVRNTRIFEYHVKDILLHKKMMIVDNKIFIVGSYNLGTRSDLSDYELVLRIENDEIAQDAKRVHQRDLEHSIEITPKQAREWYFDPVKAYLGEIQRRFHGLL